MSPPTPAPNFYLHALTQSAEAKYSFFSPHTVSIRYTCFILYTRKNEIFLRKKETLKAIHNIHSFFSTKNIQRVCIWMEELPGCTQLYTYTFTKCAMLSPHLPRYVCVVYVFIYYSIQREGSFTFIISPTSMHGEKRRTHKMYFPDLAISFK